jgi:hypothetical protein
MASRPGWLDLDSSCNNNSIHVSLLHPLVCVCLSPTLPHHGQVLSENEMASVLRIHLLLLLQQQLQTPLVISLPLMSSERAQGPYNLQPLGWLPRDSLNMSPSFCIHGCHCCSLQASPPLPSSLMMHTGCHCRPLRTTAYVSLHA